MPHKYMKTIKLITLNIFILILFGCSGHPNNNPVDLKNHLNKYEKLVILIQKECIKGENIDTSKLSKDIIDLLDTLNINSITYYSEDTNSIYSGENIIRFCGEGNMFTRDSCYTYNYGNNELEIRNNINSGCERTKLFGKWYKEYIYFD
jgi:hypothetical protein